MNYFVSVEDSYYHNWQLELLIESFKLLGLGDNLYISVAKSDKEYFKNNKNLLTHAKKYIHKNIGRESGILKLNKWGSLYTLIEKNIINLPITVLDPDVVIYKDIKIQDEQLIFSFDPSFTYNKKYSRFIKIPKDEMDKWPNLGEVFVFNDLSSNFFKDMAIFCQMVGLDPNRYQTDKLALLGALWKHKVNRILPSIDIEGNLIESQLKNIISYRHGVNPAFNKKLYKNNNMNFSMASDNPIKLLSRMDYTPSLEYVSNIAKRLL